MRELELIRGIRRRWGGAGRGVALGIGDDCAILRPPRGHELLVTTDLSLEGRHFRRDWHPPRAIGHRVLARGLSDLAAMGARPLAAFLSLALPAELVSERQGQRWVRALLAGLSELAETAGVRLAGGDTAESAGGVVADIVLVGTAPAGTSLRRGGARPGDALYVTGALGGAAAELELLRRGMSAGREATHPHLYPQPRLKVGWELRRSLATAAIDVSDGLSTDLGHLCSESGVGAEVEEQALPVHPLARGARQEKSGDARAGIRLALHGGEDYELLFAARAGTRVPKRIAGVPVTRIGSVVRGRRVTLVGADGRRRPLRAGGWEHFRR